MAKLTKSLTFETTFSTYTVNEVLGEGGSGRVYGGQNSEGAQIALKILSPETVTTDKRRRFKNELTFLGQNKHPNIVTVVDHGISPGPKGPLPFYVMQRYGSNLRELIRKGIPPENVLPLFSQVIDGVEAAHLKGVVHRDLKPENILLDEAPLRLAIADFGVARFTEDILATTVETGPTQRLANFIYAAPEQRAMGKSVGPTADIYAAALILNEMFTGLVPHGTEYRLIRDVFPEGGFLDEIVARMLRQSPEERPNSIADVKILVQKHREEAVTLQKISKIDGTVIQSRAIDEPLAEVPPKLVGADWNRGRLTLTLDKPVTQEWIMALHRMTSYTSLMGKPPQMFSFTGKIVTIDAPEYQVQGLIDNFKSWLPMASMTLKSLLVQAAQREEAAHREQLRREREAEEQRLRVMRNLRI